MGVSQLPDVPVPYRPTAAERAAATRIVRRNALDEADAQQLLDALGLIEEGDR